MMQGMGNHPTLAALALIAPWMLLGALLVSLPVAAHLLNRKARRKLVFPNIELLKASSASQSSLFRMRRWVLLVLRVLAVLLIVAAFARPLWSNDPAIASSGDQGSAVVLLVDRSVSVGQQGGGTSGGVSGVQSLRASSDQVLAEMVSGVESANLVYADAAPSAALPSMTSNLNLLRQELDQFEVTQQRADFESAIAKAGELLREKSGEAGGHLVVLSDLQQTNWADVDLKSASAKLPKGTRVTIVPPATQVSDNVAISAPRIEPATPVAGQPATLRARLVNYADTPRTVTVTLRIDSRSQGTRLVKLEPWQQREVVFTQAFDQVGDHRVEMMIDGDALAADNTAYLAVRVYERVPVVIIGDSEPNESGTDTYFLSRAVAPRGGEADSHEVRYVTSQEPVAGQFDGAAVVLIGGSKKLGGSLLTALQQYLQNGGGVVVFSDDGPVKENLALIVDQANGGAIPWEPLQLRNLGAQGNWIRLAEGDWRSALLESFDPASQEALGQIAFRRVWRVGEPHRDTRVLMSFEDGSPAVGEIPVGMGRLVVCNFSPGLAASDLGKYGSFVALTHALVEGLMPRFGGNTQIAPGMPLSMGNIVGYDPAGDAPRVLGPDDKPISDAVFSTVGELPIASVRSADRAGFYRVVQGDNTLALAAVNVDPLESDPRRVAEADLARRFSEAGAVAVQADASSTGDLLQLRGTPLWGWAAALAMTLLAVEMLFVGYFRR